VRWGIACLANLTTELCSVRIFIVLRDKGSACWKLGRRGKVTSVTGSVVNSSVKQHRLRSGQVLRQVQLSINSEFLRNLKCGVLNLVWEFTKKLFYNLTNYCTNYTVNCGLSFDYHNLEYNSWVPASLVLLPGADMASISWIIFLVTGEWSVNARAEQYWKAKLSKPSTKVGELWYLLIMGVGERGSLISIIVVWR